ncbi:uncharacterized protein LOC119332446 [Triticum dicoccoides]|uniref:uncharacterized protein LOC119332446 n=1 Tax=Triticum dicoccoides TaxID=85692 RepID=UPI0018915A51|nr:uncharacterized protein LOC119332446 [Triticum dicoccoides]
MAPGGRGRRKAGGLEPWRAADPAAQQATAAASGGFGGGFSSSSGGDSSGAAASTAASAAAQAATPAARRLQRRLQQATATVGVWDSVLSRLLEDGRKGKGTSKSKEKRKRFEKVLGCFPIETCLYFHCIWLFVRSVY